MLLGSRSIAVGHRVALCSAQFPGDSRAGNFTGLTLPAAMTLSAVLYMLFAHLF